MHEVFEYKPSGVCPSRITFAIDDGKLHDVKFSGGCRGNLGAISRLIEGADAAKIADILRGNQCGKRGTSCADQLSRAIDEALHKAS